MCMRNRLGKMGRKASWMLVLLAACGVTSSCKDEYFYDDETPSWLNSSIYESLQEKGNFKNYLRLLGDADVNPTNARPLTEVLSRTGSKTVFVADDQAWEEFFKANAALPESNPWHTATSYENLSVSQKKLLIHTSMLNNSIVMENLASSEGSSVVRGEYMRRYTDVEVTDSITFVDGESLPVNFNVRNDEADYWHRFRAENDGKGIYLVNDSSPSMMLHFTSEHMTKNNITDPDFAVFMGRERVTSDVHIYDALLKEKDAVCQNGYVNVTEKVLHPLANMAEVIRTNGKTNIFSHMLDRWSAPYFNNGVTEAYKNVMQAKGITWTDSIFSKRYISQLSWGHQELNIDPQGNKFPASIGKLKFDPGWNGFYDEKQGPQFDMASMFVPNDDALWAYFTEGGGGWQLIQTYYLRVGMEDEIAYTRPTNLDELYHQIDQIPMSTLQSLINIIMFKSFIASVPSKMMKLRDDAQEQIFYAEDRDHIVGTELANNGIIYITDKVYGPADYTSVAAPAFIGETLNAVMKFAIYNGSGIFGGSSDYMGLNYYAYLKAMQSRFVLFLPSDEALQYYYDPVSFTSQKPRSLKFAFDWTTKQFPIKYTIWAYDQANGEIGKQYNLEKMTNNEVTNRLKDILESHTLVLDGKEELNSDIDQYYLTKNGSAVKVTRENGHIVKVQGGFQLENEEAGIAGVDKGVSINQVTDEQDLSNGTTYILDSPIIPASKSVYNVLTDGGNFDSPLYGRFYDLCEINEEIVRACGLVDETHLTQKQQAAEMKKYQIFINDKGPDYNVQFFNNFNYSIFVPTNDAVDAAVAQGLPTWDDIVADYENLKQPNEEGEDSIYVLTTADSLRLQTKITYLINFIRYHFADNSVFVDNSNFASTEYVTASYDNVKGLFCKLNIKREGKQLMVQDANDGKWNTVEGRYNILARDVSCSASPTGKSTMNGITIDGSSFAVIHQIPGVLNHTELTNGRYDGAWATESNCKSYLKRFAIR